MSSPACPVTFGRPCDAVIHDVLTGVRLLARSSALWRLPLGARRRTIRRTRKRIVVVDAGRRRRLARPRWRLLTTDVKIRDKVVFTFRAPHADKSPVARAKSISRVRSTGSSRTPSSSATSVTGRPRTSPSSSSVETPVITLGQEDAEVSGEALNVLAAKVTTRVADGSVRGAQAKRDRDHRLQRLASSSSPLIAFWLLGRVGLAEKLRTWMTENRSGSRGSASERSRWSAPARRAAARRSRSRSAIDSRSSSSYALLLFSLSLFEATKGYGEVTGFIVTPIYALASCIGSALPVAIIAALAALAVSVLVRFVGLFFDSVARGDTRIAWFPRELARPTSTLPRSGIIVARFPSSARRSSRARATASSRVGLSSRSSRSLALLRSSPSAAAGTVVLYGRRVKKGELVEFGGSPARVVDVRLFDACSPRTPRSPTSACRICSAHSSDAHPPAPAARVARRRGRSVRAPGRRRAGGLLDAARSISSRGRVELVYLDASAPTGASTARPTVATPRSARRAGRPHQARRRPREEDRTVSAIAL